MEKKILNKKKTILLLGASSDIGIETVKQFIDNSDHYIIGHAYKNSKLLNTFYKTKRFKHFSLDLSNSSNVEKFLKKNKKLFKNVDVFISLTGYLRKDNKKYICNSESILKHIKANFLSNLIFLDYLLPRMKLKKFGRVLLSSSIGIKFGGSPSTISYSISKYLNEFFPSSYNKYYSSNVFFNTIRIGVTNTKIHKKTPNKNLKRRVALIPTKKIATACDVAQYIFYYASEKNNLINKQIIDISGGE